MRTAKQDGKERCRWIFTFILLLLTGVLCLGALLFSQIGAESPGLGFIPVDLHSMLEADYGADSDPARVSGVRLDLIWDAIYDREPESDLEARKAALVASLQIPVPYVTRQACQGIHIIYASQDTWIDSVNPTATYGSDTRLQLGRNGDHLQRTLLYFPINESVPQGTFIYSAHLQMNLEAAAGEVDAGPISSYNLTSPFLEATTNWSNQPDPYAYYRAPEVAAVSVHAWDVTDVVRDWLLDHYQNAGLVLEPQLSTDFALVYYSREADNQANRELADATNRVGPRLVIDCGGVAPGPDEIAAAPPALEVNTPAPPPTGKEPDRATHPPPTLPLPGETPTPPSSTSTPPAPTPTLTQVSPTPTPPSPVPTNPPPRPTDEPPDDDPPPPDVGINDVVMTEGDAGTVNVSFNVALSSASGHLVTVDYATADGTAAAPGDYSPANGTLIFAPGVIARTLTITIQGDTLNEPDETFFVNLSSANNATIADNQGVGTILDDDATPSLSIDDVSVTEGTGGTTDAVFTVSLSAPSSQTVTVDYTTADGTATAPADYTAITLTTLTFNPGATTQTLTVTIQSDALDEPDETFSVDLSNPVNAAIADNQGQGTIIDDDIEANLTISKRDTPDPVLAGQPLTYTLTITNNGPSAAANITVADNLPGGVNFNSASPGCGEIGGTVTCTLAFLPASASSQFTVTVEVISTTTGIITNTSSVTATTADPDAGDNADSQSTTITPLADLGLSKTVDNIMPSEGITVTYTLTVTNNGPQDATGVTINDTLPGGVSYVSDNSGGAYNSITGAWNVGALTNGSSATLTITGTVDAGTVNTTITNTVTISHSDQADSDTGNNTAQAAIAVVPALTINDVTVTEGDSGTVDAVFSVTLSTTSTQTISVDYATADGTATLMGSDYIPTSGTLTFLAGTTAQTLTVQVRGDTLEEVNEIFLVALSNPTNTYLENDQGVGTIINDDFDPNLVTVCFGSEQDAWLEEDHPNDNNGPDKELKTRPGAGTRRHVLIAFDLASIPPGSNVLTSTFFFYQETEQDNQIAYVHRVTSDWTESEVTWNERSTGIPWSAAGGDYITATTVSTFTPDVHNAFRHLEVTNVTQGWVNGAFGNYGLLVRTTGDDGETKFRGKEADQAYKRPQLCLTYDPAESDLAVTKTVDNPAPIEGDTIAFTVTVTNNGPDGATGVVISDALPSGLTYFAGTPSQGSYNSGTGVWNVGSVASLANVTLIITATVDTGTAGTTITNTATISAADQVDSIPANNTDQVTITPGASGLSVPEDGDRPALPDTGRWLYLPLIMR